MAQPALKRISLDELRYAVTATAASLSSVRNDCTRWSISKRMRSVRLSLEAAAAEVRAAGAGLEEARENTELNLRAYETELVETEDVVEAQMLETMTREPLNLTPRGELI